MLQMHLLAAGILALAASAPITANVIPQAQALRTVDDDWPEKPCLDSPPYSKSYLKEVWQKYYDYKGKERMEMKKVAMDRAIKDGKLKEWIEDGDTLNYHANYNTYFYYYISDQVPDMYNSSWMVRNDVADITYRIDDPTSFIVLAGICTAGLLAAFYTVKKIHKNS